MADGSSHQNRGVVQTQLIPNGDMGHSSGGTSMGNSTGTTIEQYKELFGPDAENLILDSQRRRRTQRHHLPDKLKGPSLYLTDQVNQSILAYVSPVYMVKDIPLLMYLIGLFRRWTA